MPRRPGPALALAGVLFAVAFGTNVPTPLLLVYRSTLDLSATTLTAIFGVYAAGLLPALLVAGPLSDRVGRRPVVVPFVVLSAVASLVFLPAAGSVPLLFVGRFLQGVVSGAVFSVGSAWLAEHTGDAAAAARRAGIALSSGWAVGPLASGLIAEAAGGTAGGWGATVAPYLVHLAVMAPALWVLRRIPETRARVAEPRPLLNLGVPAPARLAFWAFVAPAAFCVFTFASLSVTVLPLFLEAEIAGVEVAVTGVVAGLTLAVGALVQRPLTRVRATLSAPLGVASGSVGLGITLVAAATGIWPLILVAAVLFGGGYGCCLASGLTATEHLADPEERGALTATFYAAAYLGFGAPFLVSIVARTTGFGPPLAVLAGLTSALTLWLLLGPGRRALAERTRAAVEDR
jgi:predicted MFS family arabinose efflux permease